jgi:type I restriction enzyme S subunit
MTAIDDLMTATTATQSWKRVQIKDIYLALYDGPHATPKPASEGAVFLGIKNITEDGKLDLSDIRYISEEDFPKWTRRVLPRPGDMVFTYEATLNRYAIIPEGFRGCLGRRLALIRPNLKKVDTRFLFYYFFGENWRKTIATNLIFGSTVDRIPLTNFPKFEISLPPLPIQRKIAAILSAYDDLIENNTRRIEILEEMARSLYREWFVNFRFPGHEQVKMVDSELGLIPEGWEVKPLSDVCSRITDGSHWSPKTVEEGYPMASVKDMHTWGLYVDQCRKISEEDYIQLVRNGCKPLKGDVLITKDGNTYLKHIFVIEKEIELVILSSIAILRPNEQILSYLLAFYLREPTVKPRLANYVSGAAIPRVVLKDFKRFPIVLPPRELQDKFFRLAEAMVKNCHCFLDKNANLRKTRDLLLPKLISGEIDVENLDINAGAIAA